MRARVGYTALFYGVAALVAVVVTVSAFRSVQHNRADEQNRQARLGWLTKTENSGDRALSRLILAELLKDYPEDKELAQYWEREVGSHADEPKRPNDGERELSSLESQLSALRKLISVSEERRTSLERDMSSFADSLRAGVGAQEQQQKRPDTEENFLLLLLSEHPNLNPAPPGTNDKTLGEAIDSAARGDWNAARCGASSVLRSVPNHARAASLWIYATIRQSPESKQEQAKMLPVLETLLRLDPNNYFALYCSALAYQNAGSSSLAQERFTKAVEARPAAREARIGLIDSLLSSGQIGSAKAEALKLWNAGDREESTAKLVWETLAMESEEERSAFLDSWAQAQPRSPWPGLYEGDILLANGRLDQAAAEYRQSLQRTWTLSGQQKLATASYQAGDFDTAASAYRQLLKSVNPSDPNRHTEYELVAGRLVDADVRASSWSDAISDAEGILRQDPEFLAIRVQLGSVYLKLGDARRARTALEPGTNSCDGIVLIEDLFEAYWELKEYRSITQKIAAMTSWSLSDEQRAMVQRWKEKVDKVGTRS